MLSDRMQEALNQQINRELYSSYLYLAMAAWLDDQGLKGCSHWMRVQHKEEEIHGLMMFGYLQSAGGRAALAAIDAPPAEWDSPLAVFEQVLKHEQFVTQCIHELVDVALDVRDHATNAFLQWFVTEQVEEEAKAKDLRDTFKLVGSDGSALLMLDRELAARVFNPPVEAAAYGVI